MAHSRTPEPGLPPVRGEGERGYVLLTVMWLLLLGGAIAGLILMTSVTRARATRSDVDVARTAHAFESAFATVAADRLFDGKSSRWARLPSSGVIELDGLSVAIKVSAEDERVDLNAAEPDVLARAIRNAVTTPMVGERLLGAVLARRATGVPFRSIQEWDGMLSDDQDLRYAVTIASGLSQPRTAAVGSGRDASVAAPASFAATRIETKMAGGHSSPTLTTVIRAASQHGSGTLDRTRF